MVATEDVRTPWHTLTPQAALRSRQALRHHANAILREDARGARLAKETKDSPRRIGGAVAAVMAVHLAAELAGAGRLDIYL